MLLSPALTFLMFTFLPTRYGGSPVLTAQIAFTSLSLISLLTSPLEILASAYSRFTAAMGSFDRIQRYFLLASQHQEEAQHTLAPSRTHKNLGRVRESNYIIEGQDIQLLQISPALKSDALFSLKACNFGVPPSHPALLRDISLTINRESLTVILGPVGCGKTTLLKALMSEVQRTDGEMQVPNVEFAYCQQSPWLTNSSIRENIIGKSSDFDQSWYDKVIGACALETDLLSLPNGDETVVGSKGSALSGGQKQRVVSFTSFPVFSMTADSI